MGSKLKADATVMVCEASCSMGTEVLRWCCDGGRCMWSHVLRLQQEACQGPSLSRCAGCGWSTATNACCAPLPALA